MKKHSREEAEMRAARAAAKVYLALSSEELRAVVYESRFRDRRGISAYFGHSGNLTSKALASWLKTHLGTPARNRICRAYLRVSSSASLDLLAEVVVLVADEIARVTVFHGIPLLAIAALIVKTTLRDCCKQESK